MKKVRAGHGTAELTTASGGKLWVLVNGAKKTSGVFLTIQNRIIDKYAVLNRQKTPEVLFPLLPHDRQPQHQDCQQN